MPETITVEQFRKQNPGKEKDLQKATADYCTYMGLIHHHCPMEGKRGWVSQRDLKESGASPGFPDHMIFNTTTDGYKGIALELKVGRKKPTEHQQKWLQDLTSTGWKTYVAYNINQVMEFINSNYQH